MAATRTLFATLIGEQVSVSFRPGNALWPVLCDPSQIDQILLRRRIELRFRLDAAGRLLGENLPEDPADRNAPRLYACLGPDLLVYAFRNEALKNAGYK